jgi:hypothetical protein
MSDFAAILFLFGAVGTAVAFTALFAKRYPKQRRWLVLGMLSGVAAMFAWPLTLWAAVAMWLTGFARPDPSADPPIKIGKNVVIPLCALGAVLSLAGVASAAGPLAAPTSPTGPMAAATSSASSPPTSSSPAPPPPPLTSGFRPE